MEEDKKENEEVSVDKVSAVAEILRMDEFNKALVEVQNYTRYAEHLVGQYPDKTPEEIGIVFDKIAELTEFLDKDSNRSENNLEFAEKFVKNNEGLSIDELKLKYLKEKTIGENNKNIEKDEDNENYNKYENIEKDEDNKNNDIDR